MNTVPYLSNFAYWSKTPEEQEGTRATLNWNHISNQCCDSGMLIPDPDFSIPDLGSKKKMRENKIENLLFTLTSPYRNFLNFLGIKEKNMTIDVAKFKFLFLNKKWLLALRKIVRPGNRQKHFRISNTGIKKYRIPDPDTQHCL